MKDRSHLEGRQQYLEQYGSALVTNNYLRIALFAVSLALLGMIGITFGVYSWAKNQKPLIIRISDIGRAEALAYSALGYSPQDVELRYFLAQFTQLHFGRMAATVKERFGRSLYFLDRKLSQAVMDEERKNQSITKFICEGSDEIDIEIENVALQDLRSVPMKGTVDFQKVYYSRADHQELRRERYAGYFEFGVQDVPNSFVLVNPLGLIITYFRTDAAFR
jgi:type IV secretory pathway TrbF-like protein